MQIEKLTPIDWLIAMDGLSIGAFYLLNVLWRQDIDVNDEALMKYTGYGISTHRKHKSELVRKSYLTKIQTGRGEYLYQLKDINV